MPFLECRVDLAQAYLKNKNYHSLLLYQVRLIQVREIHGNDNSRDWKTLIDSWDYSLPTLKIVTSKTLNTNKNNIHIIKGDWKENFLTDEQILSLYNGSKFVVIPLIETIQPSGQSVCLQAMACEKPVIISSISGLWDHSKLIHKENIMLVKPENPSLFTTSAIPFVMSLPSIYPI